MSESTVVDSASRLADLRPLGDRVLIRRLNQEEKTPGGIMLPDVDKGKAQKGKVIAVGPGRWHEKEMQRVPMEVKVGDIVLLPQYGGVEVSEALRDDELFVLTQQEILAVLGG